MFVSADVTNLMYNLSVSGANWPLVTVTTSDTNYCLELTLCQEYTITVTPFSISPGYVGTSNSTNATIDGGTCAVIKNTEQFTVVYPEILGNFCVC